MDLYQVALDWAEKQHIQDEEWREFMLEEYLIYLKDLTKDDGVNCRVIYLPFYTNQDNMELC